MVVSPRRRKSYQTCLVVLFSTVVPDPVESFHFKIPANRYSFFRTDTDVWAKADMITHVALSRLDRIKDGIQWCSPLLNTNDICAIQNAVLNALGKSLTAPVNTRELAFKTKDTVDIESE